MKKYTRGFTLIELLVVIAIIGILSSVVLVSLSSARSKAKDANVQSQLASLKSAGEMYFGTNGAYLTGTPDDAPDTCYYLNTFFSDSATGMPLMDGIDTQVSATVGSFTGMDCSMDLTGSMWRVSVKLPSSTGGYVCVDSSGATKKYATAPSVGNVCP